MRYSGLIKNDIAAGEGVNVTFFVQGCPLRCENCHNPETWDFEGGKEFTTDTLNEIIQSLEANNIQRNFSIMGGEPLASENVFLTALLINVVKEKYPDIKIYLWTGYIIEDLIKRNESKTTYILENIDYLIDGPYIDAERDITLAMCGSRNQRVIDMKEYRNAILDR